MEGCDLVIVEGRHDAPWPVLRLHAPGRPAREISGPVLADLEVVDGAPPVAEALAVLRSLWR